MPAQPVTCPDCQATLQIDDKLFGKPVACGSCRKTFVPIRPNVPVAELKVRVPAPPAAPPPAPPPPMPVPNEYSRETAPRSNYGSRKTKPIYDEDEEVEERDEKPQRNKPK